MTGNNIARRDPSLETRDDSGGIVEIGANSLKFHCFYSGNIHTVKYVYDLGHEVYETGNVSQRTVRRIVAIIRRHGAPSFAIGTSAVRDAQNSKFLSRRLHDEFDLDLHILSCFEESSLLARAYMGHSKCRPALVMDIGGGSVESVFLTKTRNIVWDSLPIGVIQAHHRWKDDGLSAMNEWVDTHLRKASIVMAREIFATGGTVKAIARTLKKTTLNHRDLTELEARVTRHGAPPGLTPARARVLLPGVMVTRRLLEFVRAERMQYTGISIGRQALEECLRSVIPNARSRRVRRSSVSRH